MFIIEPKGWHPPTTAVYVALGLLAVVYVPAIHSGRNVAGDVGTLFGSALSVGLWARVARRRGRSQWCALWGWLGLLGLLGILLLEDKSDRVELIP